MMKITILTSFAHNFKLFMRLFYKPHKLKQPKERVVTGRGRA